MTALQHAVLEALDGARNYNAWVASLAMPYLGDDPIEIGSGTGTFAEAWLEAGVSKLTVSEVDSDLIGVLEQRFADQERVTVRELNLLDAVAGEHSCVVALNVLEHIADDVAALRAATRLVRPGGAVVMFVPAFPFAMSRFDRAIGHYRRYTAKTAREAFVAAGLAVGELRYVNLPGLVAWTVGMRLLGMHPREGLVLRTWDRASYRRRARSRIAGGHPSGSHCSSRDAGPPDLLSLVAAPAGAPTGEPPDPYARRTSSVAVTLAA